MKIIHTSDWHLGQVFHNYDRTPEHKDMLRQIVDIVRDEQPDAFLVSGDVFHTGNPPTAAVKMYNEALLAIHDACPTAQIILTAGNHDSAARLVVNNDLWDYFKVNVIGTVAKNRDEDRTPDFDSHIIKITDKEGRPLGFVVAVPHCYESNFPTQEQTLQREERMRDYFRQMGTHLSDINAEGLPTVLMAHLAVSGCDFSGHDNIGGMETRDITILGDGYDYIALGHIHTPHNINDRARYCGTPVPVNFGERFDHSVSVVTVETGSLPVIKTRSIKNLIPLHDFPTEPKPFKEVLESIKDYDNDECCYIRVLVKVDSSMTPLASTLIEEAVRGKKCRVCYIQPFYDEVETKAKTKQRVMTSHELKTKTPLEIAEMFFDMKGIELTKHQRDIIREATVTATEEMQP